MKCKPGDLAIIVDPYHPENAGLIVHVIKTHWNQNALEKSEGDHLWLVECQQPMTYSYGEILRRKKRGPAQDSVMQPIRGPQMDRDIARERPGAPGTGVCNAPIDEGLDLNPKKEN